MPSKADLIRQSEQGGRVKEIREALDLTGEAFGERLERIAKDAGLAASYGKDKISRIESGRQAMSAEEMLLIARLDKQGRGAEWLAFGDGRRAIVENRRVPITPTSAAAQRKKGTGGSH